MFRERTGCRVAATVGRRTDETARPEGALTAHAGTPRPGEVAIGVLPVRATPECHGVRRLPAFFRAEGGEDLLALVRDAADAGVGRPFMARVFPERAGASAPVMLTLRPVAAGLVVGVLSDGTNTRSGAVHAVGALRSVWEGLVEGMAVAIRDPSGRVERITAANGAFASMFGLETDEVVGQPLAHLLAPVNGGVFTRRVEDEVMAEGTTIADLTMVWRTTPTDRRLLAWEVAPVRGPDGRTLGVIAVVRDTREAARPLAWKPKDCDPSSGLPNHVHFLRPGWSDPWSARHRPGPIPSRWWGWRCGAPGRGAAPRNAGVEHRPGGAGAATGAARALDHVLERLQRVAAAPYTIADQPRTILRSLLSLGRDLGWHLSVGGVETRSRAEALRSIGCDFAQGFFYHGPLDALQAAALMRQSTERGGEPPTH